MFLSAIVPVYNEVSTIRKILEQVAAEPGGGYGALEVRILCSGPVARPLLPPHPPLICWDPPLQERSERVSFGSESGPILRDLVC